MIDSAVSTSWPASLDETVTVHVPASVPGVSQVWLVIAPTPLPVPTVTVVPLGASNMPSTVSISTSRVKVWSSPAMLVSSASTTTRASTHSVVAERSPPGVTWRLPWGNVA